MIRRICAAILLTALISGTGWASLPAPAAIDAAVQKVMASTGSKGLALAVIDDGRVVYRQAYGIRNAKGEALTTDTVMYGASLTKLVVAYAALQLVDKGILSLDTPFADDLDKPLPTYGPDPVFPHKYGPYGDLAGDERWRKLTPRMVLTHSTGFANFAFMEPDRKLRIHFEPGTRFAYSGEGFVLLQFAIEHGRADKGLGIDLGDFAQKNIFAPLGMTRTSLKWRDDLAVNCADGWDSQGNILPHNRRGKVGAAGSMDTTLNDLAKFAATLMSGSGLSADSRAEMVKRQLQITTRSMFPTLQPELAPAERNASHYAGLGVELFDGPQGRAFHKGGHDDATANTLVGVEAGRRCVLILSNDVRTEAAFPELVTFILGDTGMPAGW